MISFKIEKHSKKSRARLGVLKTSQSTVRTPCLVPVATQAVVKTLDSEEVKLTKSQILICNTYHLHLKPGEDIVEKAGGLHKFMNWKGSLMTDSGGFQVFSLGFGRDFQIGKINKSRSPAKKIMVGEQPKLLKITERGVYFRSVVDGRKLFLGPEESMKIQEKLGADIIFAFDECTSPLSSYEYTEKSLRKTNKWAEICLRAKNSKQALFGIVQGGRYKSLRKASARFVAPLPFDGFGIGGEFGNDKKTMSQMLKWVVEELPEEKPRHLLGIGYLEDIPRIIREGVDLFDCNVPTHYARRGVAFTSKGELKLKKSIFLKDKSPLDKSCSCYVCGKYTRSYISHLLKAEEITALKLITFHNLYFFNSFVENIRRQIKLGKF